MTQAPWLLGALLLTSSCTQLVSWLPGTKPPPPPKVLITVTWSGASAVDIERQITVPIEHAVLALPGVAHIRGVSQRERSVVEVTVDDAHDVTSVIAALHSRLPLTELPSEADFPVVHSRGEQPHFAWFTLSGAVTPSVAAGFAEDARLRVLTTPGFADVSLCGQLERTARVMVDNQRMLAHGLTVLDVRDALRTAEPAPHDPNNATSLEALSQVPAGSRDGVEIRLRDVAHVEDGFAPPSCLAWHGERTIAATVVVQANAEPRLLRGAVDSALADAPAGITVRRFGDEARVTRGQVLLPLGLSLDERWRIVTTLAERVASHGEVADVLATVTPTAAQLWVAYRSAARRRGELSGLLDVVRSVPGANYVPETSLRVQVLGADRETSTAFAEKLRQTLAAEPTVAGAVLLNTLGPELTTRINREMLARVGVASADVNDTLAVLSDNGLRVASGASPIRVLVGPKGGNGLRDGLSGVMVRSSNGALVPLQQLVDVLQVSAPQELLRVDGAPCVELAVFGEKAMEDGTLEEVVRERLKAVDLPVGHAVQLIR